MPIPCAECPKIATLGRVNTREFRQHVADLLARERKKAEAQAKKAPAREKPKRAMSA